MAATTARSRPASTPTRSARASRPSSSGPSTSPPRQFGGPDAVPIQREPGRRPGLRGPLHGPVHRQPGARAGAELRGPAQLRPQTRADDSPAGRRSPASTSRYRTWTTSSADATGRTIQLFQLVSEPDERQFRITNPPIMKSDINAVSLGLFKHMSDKWQLTASGDLDARRGHAPGRAGRRGRGGLRRRDHPARRAAVPPVRPEPERLRERGRTAEERRRVAVQGPGRLPAPGRVPGLGELHQPQRRPPRAAHARAEDGLSPTFPRTRRSCSSRAARTAGWRRHDPRRPAAEGLQAGRDGRVSRCSRTPSTCSTPTRPRVS